MPTYRFSTDQIEIINQKADHNHSDNDWLSIVWSISDTATKNVQSFNKTLRTGGVLHTGDSIPGPFATDDFEMGVNDVLTVLLTLTNLGSSDAETQFASAVKITNAVTGVLAPILGGIVGGIVAGDPEAGSEIGEKIAGQLSSLTDMIGTIADALGIHAGPPNCNGEVFHDTWTYTSAEISQDVGVSASRSYTGPARDGCGIAPNTKITFSVAQTQTPARSMLLYRQTGATFAAGFHSETQIGPSTPVGQWENDWTQIKPVFLDKPYLLLYRKTDGAAFLAGIDSAAKVEAPVLIGTWEKDWTQIVPLFDGRILLLYRQSDGKAFTAPLSTAEKPGAFTVGATTQIGLWEKDWSQIVPFCVNGDWFLLLYRQTDGRAFTAPVVFKGQNAAPTFGTPTQVGLWENDWSQILTYNPSGTTYILLYRESDGAAFAAPINSSTAIGHVSKVGVWEKDWSQIVPVPFAQ